MSGEETPRATTVLIAALGGEGGGVLADWLSQAARASDLPVQATSIPGVAQRTGATTYYVEIWPQTWRRLGGKNPVLALAPALGEVDVMAATELLETGRAIGNGFVTPRVTTLVASTHRMYTTVEKMTMGDGSFDYQRLLDSAHNGGAEGETNPNILFDMGKVAKESDAPLNAVLLGAIAASGRLPLTDQAFRDGIAAEGKMVAANLRGFDAGMAAARAALGNGSSGEADGVRRTLDGGAQNGGSPGGKANSLEVRIGEEFPEPLHAMLSLAVGRLTDYQDRRYAALLLDRLQPFRGSPQSLLESVTRQLVLWMSYEDAIRVAQAKTRPERIRRVRAETGAAPGEPVAITEFLKPGLQEICDVLPEWPARLLLALSRHQPGKKARRKGMYIRTDTVWGFLQLRLLAGLRVWRRITWRYGREQEAIGAWLETVRRAAERDPDLAREIAECAGLIKGYGETHERGSGNFQRIEAALIRPALEQKGDSAQVAGRYTPMTRQIAQARKAAMADPEGKALDELLAGLGVGGHGSPVPGANPDGVAGD